MKYPSNNGYSHAIDKSPSLTLRLMSRLNQIPSLAYLLCPEALDVLASWVTFGTLQANHQSTGLPFSSIAINAIFHPQLDEMPVSQDSADFSAGCAIIIFYVHVSIF